MGMQNRSLGTGLLLGRGGSLSDWVFNVICSWGGYVF